LYHTKAVGGVGFQNLYTKQGLAQVKYIIEGWRIQNLVTNTIKTLLQSYMVAIGITANPLEGKQIFHTLSLGGLTQSKDIYNASRDNF
jgi:hypothetical protein